MEEPTPTFTPIIIDGHQDLAWNMLNFQRDYVRSVAETRQQEKGSWIPDANGDSLLGWPEYQSGRVAVIFSALFGMPMRLKRAAWDSQVYITAQQAHKLYRRQLERYYQLVDEAPAQFRLIKTCQDLDEVIRDWEDTSKPAHPVGMVISMEGAEGIRAPAETEEWWEMGLRVIGPAWAGTRFCGGTNEPGPLTKEGYQLLESMADCGFILDLTHMDVRATLQALDTYPKGIIASHSNAHRLLRGLETNRHLPDEVIRGLIERDGIIGVNFYNGFLLPNWRPGDNRQLVTLQHVIAQIDYICQMAGDALHAALGTDFEGGFGLQSVPTEIDTIADLQKLVPLLLEKGYSPQDVSHILGGNWLRFLRQTLPETI